MLIACDVDSTVAAIIPPWLDRYNEEYGDDFTYEQCDSWDFYEKTDAKGYLFEYLMLPTFYDDVFPTAGAQEGVAKILLSGNDVVFVSSCLKGTADTKHDWLVRWGFLSPTQYGNMGKGFVAASDKTLIAADLLIEDNASTCVEWVKRRNRPVILLDRPWNKNFESRLFPYIHRAYDWAEVAAKVTGSFNSDEES